jgi:hypothetical protein
MPPERFSCQARANSTKNRLYRFKRNLGAKILPGFREEFASLAAHMIDNPYLNGEVVRLDAALRMAPR